MSRTGLLPLRPRREEEEPRTGSASSASCTPHRPLPAGRRSRPAAPPAGWEEELFDSPALITGNCEVFKMFMRFIIIVLLFYIMLSVWTGYFYL